MLVSEIFFKDVGGQKVAHKINLSETPGGPLIAPEPFSVKHFRAAFAVTVFKYQGSTIDEPFNIYDTKLLKTGQNRQMSRNELYTALTRGKKLSDVHIIYSDRVFEASKEPEESTPIRHEKPEYGYIYEMFNEKNTVYYIGQTKKSVQERFSAHKEDPKDIMHKYDGTWTVKQLTKMHIFGMERGKTLYTSISIDWTHSHQQN